MPFWEKKKSTLILSLDQITIYTFRFILISLFGDTIPVFFINMTEKEIPRKEIQKKKDWVNVKN